MIIGGRCWHECVKTNRLSSNTHVAVKYKIDFELMARNFSTADPSDKLTTAKPRVCVLTRVVAAYRRRADEVAAVRVMVVGAWMDAIKWQAVEPLFGYSPIQFPPLLQ